MTLKELEYLIAIAEAGTMHGAAERCGVSQPTLSTQVARLEDELDCLLFERGRLGTRLTDAGERALAHARQIFECVEQLRRDCRAREHALAGPLRLGLIPTIGPYVMPRLLPHIRKGYPCTNLFLREDVTQSLLDRLKRGELDAALVSRPIDEPSLQIEDIFHESFYVVAPQGHEVSSRKSVGANELSDLPLVLLEEGHCLREQTAWLCQLQPQKALYQASSVESLRQMVAAGIGITVLPEMAVQGRYARTTGVRVVPFQSPAPTRSVSLVFRKTHPEFGALVSFAKQLAQWY